jgi:hypothetical protein
MWIVLPLSWRADRLHIREKVAATGHAAVVAAAGVIAALDICVHAVEIAEALGKLSAVVAASQIAAAALGICVRALEIAQALEKLAAAAVLVVKQLAAADSHAEIAHVLDVSVHAVAIDPVAAAVLAVLAVAVWRGLLLPVPIWATLVQEYRRRCCYFVADVAVLSAVAVAAAVDALSAAGTAADTDVPPDPSSRRTPPNATLPAGIAVDAVVGIAVDRERSYCIVLNTY